MSMIVKAPALLSLVLLPTALADQFDGVREKIKAGLEQHNVASIGVAVAKDG